MARGVFENLAGKRYGRLLVLELAGRKNSQALWRLRCDCGKEHFAITRMLNSGAVQSCGCSRRKQTAAERFWAKVEKRGTEECWLWTAARVDFGYGAFPVEHRRTIHAHRFSYELNFGPIPEGLCVLHRCDNPPCVNPAHLFLGTNADNMHDRHAKGRYATGAESWSATHKHLLARGDRSGLRLHPERAARGERNANARLTVAQVEEIRALLAQGLLKHREIAALFSVDRTTVTAINRGKNWRHAACA